MVRSKTVIQNKAGRHQSNIYSDLRNLVERGSARGADFTEVMEAI